MKKTDPGADSWLNMDERHEISFAVRYFPKMENEIPFNGNYRYNFTP
jgi:hypothetical protein